MKASLLNRKVHRVGAILTAIPLLIVIVTGIILQLKKDWAWVQPPTLKGAEGTLAVSFEEILAAAKTSPEAGIESWKDVDRIDVRPKKGVAKVRAKNRWEVQIDTSNGELLGTAYRRSDLIESLHDGSFFSNAAKLGVFLPSALVLLALWITGIYLWFLPRLKRRQRDRQRLASRESDSSAES